LIVHIVADRLLDLAIGDVVGPHGALTGLYEHTTAPTKILMRDRRIIGAFHRAQGTPCQRILQVTRRFVDELGGASIEANALTNLKSWRWAWVEDYGHRVPPS
jgi:hypothetical protein